VRFSFATSEAALREGFDRIERLVEQINREKERR
jgi:hypothetical protein